MDQLEVPPALPPLPTHVLVDLYEATREIVERAVWKAVDVLQHNPNVVAMCEPCGDQVPGAPSVARHVAMKPVAGGLFAVTLDGKDIDLAYTYVRVSEQRYQNLAMLAQCPATGVSESLVADPETRDGVLIHPDPWPKRRHWKRRFVQDTTVAAMARALKPGGEFRFVCDVDHYSAWTLSHLARSPDFRWLAERADDFRLPWSGYTLTRYGRKAAGEGRKTSYLRFVRR